MKAHVHNHNGTPTLFLDGQPAFANLQLIGGVDPQGIQATQEAIRAFAKSGVHIYSVDAVVNEWRGPYEYDFRDTAARLQMIVDADPQARQFTAVTDRLVPGTALPKPSPVFPRQDMPTADA